MLMLQICGTLWSKFWTDSQYVLHWLKTRKPLPVLVENLVQKYNHRRIYHSVTSYPIRIHHPSDCATKGLTITDIKDFSL